MDVKDNSQKTQNFSYLDDLIHSAKTEIKLDADIKFSPEDEAEYSEGIKIDVDGITIDADGHTIDADVRIFDVTAESVTIKNVRLNTLESAVHVHENAVLKLKNAYGADTINDGTLILIESYDDPQVINNGLLYVFEDEIHPGIVNNGEISRIRKLKNEESNFTCLKAMIDDTYANLLKEDAIKEDALIRFKDDVVLDMAGDECFSFKEGFVLDRGNIIIDGQGYSIDANHFTRIFTISASNVTIRNLTLKNARADEGGAVKNTGNVNLSSLTIEGCRQTRSGAIFFNEGEITAERIFMRSNRGGIYNKSGKVTLDYINFTANNTDSIIMNMGETIVMNSRFVGKNAIDNDSVLKLCNNNFDDGHVTNRKNSLVKLYRKTSQKSEEIHESTSLEITNKGKIKAYNFEGNIIPATSITEGGEVEHFTQDIVRRDEFFASNYEWIEIKLIVGSTLRDMFSERNYFSNHVFGELQDWCKKRRILLRNIDLRCASKKSIDIIDSYMDDDKSFFLCFVGQKQDWYSNLEKQSVSATLHPMVRILRDVSNVKFESRTLFFFRQNPFDGVNLTPEQKSIYFGKAEDRSEEIKQSVTDEQFTAFDYACQWNGEGIVAELASQNTVSGRLENFEHDGEPLKDLILDELKKQIEAAFPNQRPFKSEDIYFEDAMIHNLEIEYRSRSLTGKRRKLRELDSKFLNHKNKILVIHGGEGVGKSTILAKWHQTLKKDGHKSIIRLCEATLKSSTFQDLYLSIGSEAGIFNGEEEKIRSSVFEFDYDFFSKLKDKGVEVLILSNVDKIGKFAPTRVPEDFYIVLSSEDDYDIGVAHDRLALDDLKSSEVSYEFIAPYLGINLVEMNRRQKNTIVGMLKSKSPLFARIVLNEMGCLGSYDEIVSKISSFGETISDAFTRLIEILKEDNIYGEEFIASVLTRLAFAGNGLSDKELVSNPNQEEILKIFLNRIEDYIYMKDDKYYLRYEEFRNTIIDQYKSLEEDTRRDLVSLYKASMLMSEGELYPLIVGSDDLLHQLEELKDYGGILEVFKNDELLNKVEPDEYGLEYKGGTFYPYSADRLKLKVDDAEVLRQISLILLEKTDTRLRDALNRYSEPRHDLSYKFRQYDPEEFARYRDSFYETTSYFKAAATYAKESLKLEKDTSVNDEFKEKFNKDSNYVESFLMKTADSGADNLGLSHNIEDLALDALSASKF